MYSIDPSNSVSMSRWLIKISNSPVILHAIMNSPDTFALFFANLKNSVKIDDEVLSEIKNSHFYNDKKINDDFNKIFPENQKLNHIDRTNLYDGFILFNCDQLGGGKILPSIISAATENYNTYNKKKIEERELAGDNFSNDFDVIVKLDRTSKNIDLPLFKVSDKNTFNVAIPPYESITIFDCHCLILKTILPVYPFERDVLEFSYMLKMSPLLAMVYDKLTFHDYMSELFFENAFDFRGDLFEEKNKYCLFVCEMIGVNDENLKISKMNDFWFNFFSSPVKNNGELITKILTPAQSKYHSGAMGNIAKEDLDIVSHLLKHMNVARTPTNILFYSPNSIDKYSMALNIISKEKMQAYTLSSKLPDDCVRTACYIAQKLIERQDPFSILIISKAEKVLSKSRTSTRKTLFFDIEVQEEVEQSRLEAELMSNPVVKTIWLTTSPNKIHEDSLSYFTFSSEVKVASRNERKEAVEEILKDFSLSDSFKSKLSQHIQLSREQLKNAVILAEKMKNNKFNITNNDQMAQFMSVDHLDVHPEHLKAIAEITDASTYCRNQEEKEEIILKAILQSEKLMNRKEREHFKLSVTKYSTDYLNINSGFSIEQIVKAIKKRPSSTLCLFGIPGTGKTQFSEYLALCLDKPIIIKNASDLLDKYIGETEKNIDKMFKEAEETDSILLLDEGDSFLRDRSYAKNSWEVSAVNQLLQSMERFEGTFICATNLFANLDIAALRRFMFKLEFLPMTPDQKWKMFETELGDQLSAYSQSEKQKFKDDLDFLTHLTPGDFSVVKRQEFILDEKMSPDEFFKQLTFEHETKKRSMNQTYRMNEPDHL